MKLTARQIPSFLKSPDPKAQAILLYGPDEGLVRERGTLLCRTVLEDLNDPFRVAEITPAELADDPARLADEAGALSFTGGRRVVRLRGAGNRHAPALKSFLDDPKGDALIVVEAGELGPRDALRKLFEGADNAAALPCYQDEAQTLDQLISASLREVNLQVDPAAQAYLRENLGSDRAVTRRELEKLVLYMGGPDMGNPGAGGSGGPATVTLQDVQACIGDSSALGFDDVVTACLTGNQGALERYVSRAFSSGDSPIAILRTLQKQLQLLHFITGGLEGGGNVDAMFKKCRPPIRFPRDRAIRQYLRFWNSAKIATALQILTETEIDCKSTGMPDQAICRRALMRLASAAKRA